MTCYSAIQRHVNTGDSLSDFFLGSIYVHKSLTILTQRTGFMGFVHSERKVKDRLKQDRDVHKQDRDVHKQDFDFQINGTRIENNIG